MTSSEFPPYVGGVSHYAHKLSSKLIQKGHEVTIITRGSSKGLVTEQIDNIRVYRVPYLHLYPLHVKVQQIFQNQILRTLQSNLDLIHIHYPLTPSFQTSLPTIATIHTSIGPSIKSQNFYSAGPRLPPAVMHLMRLYFGQLERSIVSISDRVTVVSNAVAQELTARYSTTLNHPVEILGNGVDTEVFAPGTGNNRIQILFTGRLAWNKGLDDFVNAARIIHNTRKDASFVITGEGPIKPYLERVVKDLGLSSRFSFPGYLSLPDLIKCYQNTTVFVFPTRYEGLPTSLMEAMACAIPPVTTGIGSIPEIVQDQQNGVIVPTNAPTAIATAVINLLKDDEKRLRLGKAARKTIEERYNWNKIVDRTINCYQNVVKEKRESTQPIPSTRIT